MVSISLLENEHGLKNRRRVEITCSPKIFDHQWKGTEIMGECAGYTRAYLRQKLRKCLALDKISQQRKRAHKVANHIGKFDAWSASSGRADGDFCLAGQAVQQYLKCCQHGHEQRGLPFISQLL